MTPFFSIIIPVCNIVVRVDVWGTLTTKYTKYTKNGYIAGLTPNASHNVVRLSTKSGEMTSLEQMGRHPFGVALFIAHFVAVRNFPHSQRLCGIL